ncbi:hypothetical protein A9404_04035 [Halothiobacillus diazotrophicus]|uniref:Uncharacterized protein n=1 Tax=Halothiobacillus diazotrophicus TaxID=1860122 RepID=A0A191ZFM7_9GAMM|nr:hypothetical protein [Halothiobacillus diazotrophicus]ANJ66657.1 hypothetical protein A9404_04035 [Halothiobacillus diazotrophicus]
MEHKIPTYLVITILLLLLAWLTAWAIPRIPRLPRARWLRMMQAMSNRIIFAGLAVMLAPWLFGVLRTTPFNLPTALGGIGLIVLGLLLSAWTSRQTSGHQPEGAGKECD